MRGRAHHKRVTLSREDLDLVDRQRLSVLAVRLDDSQIMPSDREDVVRVAGNVDQSEPVAGEANRSCQLRCIEHSRQRSVPFPVSNFNDRQLRRRIAPKSTQAVNESRICSSINSCSIVLV